MQGTIAVLMALSGLGCHHKSCDVAYAPSCYSSCYSSSCYSSGCYSSVSYLPSAQSCYASAQVAMPVSYVGGCYSSCYSGYMDSCYSGCYSSCYSGCYSSCYSGCYGGGHGFFGKHRRGGGLFSCHKRSYCEPVCAPVVASCDTCAVGGGSWGWPVPVYGSYTPAYATSQGYTSYPTAQGGYSAAAPTAPAAPVTTPAPVEAPEATTPAAPVPAEPAEVTPPAPTEAPAETPVPKN